MFERLGEDQNDSAYVTPSEGDVWNFIATIKEWMTDPRRRGIPE
jgi:hypothetical protein